MVASLSNMWGKLFALLMAGSLALTVTGCSDGTTTITSSGSSEETSSDTSQEVSQEEPEEAEPAEAENSADGQPQGQGTRNNPLPFDSVVVIDTGGVPTWEVRIVEVFNDAEDLILDENMFNDPSPDGYRYVMVSLEYTYIGDDKGQPGFDVSLAYVTTSGTTHTPSDFSVVTPNDVFSINDLYAGASAIGNEAIAIPEDDALDGTWRISGFLSDEIYLEGN